MVRLRVVFALALATLLTVGAAADGGDGDGPRRAWYGDRQITMDEDWDGAGACAVFTEDDIRCWDTFEQMEQATDGHGHPRQHPGTRVRDGRSEGGQPGDGHQDGTVWAASEGFVLAADCDYDSTRWLYLWEHIDFNGRALKFNDVDYWQNLTDYGFNDMTSSFWNVTRCNAYLAEHINGGGSWLWAPAQTAYSAMPAGWNDRVSSLYILRR